ncbi:MAG: hypothetical protein IPL84_16250 [Chitinophagaceae bacterium]|nr:hypothetical protein [Chitinophagaceae bacterium]
MFTSKKIPGRLAQTGDLVLLILFVTTAGLISCKTRSVVRQIEPAFYFWKSVFTLSDFEKKKLDSLQVKTIYLKFFDVDWNEELKKPKPLATIRITDSAYKDFSIIPTVFITNACIQKIDSGQVKELADHLMGLLKGILADHHFKEIPEIQFDCDWTGSTREKYFALLKESRALMPNAKLSATIRLHQVKYLSKSGIPPVDRGY